MGGAGAGTGAGAGVGSVGGVTAAPHAKAASGTRRLSFLHSRSQSPLTTATVHLALPASLFFGVFSKAEHTWVTPRSKFCR